MICPNCGEDIREGIDICPICGFNVKEYKENEEYDIDALKPNTTLKDGKYIIKKKL